MDLNIINIMNNNNKSQNCLDVELLKMTGHTIITGFTYHFAKIQLGGAAGA